MPSKPVVAVVAGGIIIGLLIITSILSVNNGRLNQRVKVLEGKLSETGDSSVRVRALEKRVARLTRQVDATVKVTNGNAARYNELAGVVRSLAKAQTRSGGRLTGAIGEINRLSKILGHEMKTVPDKS